MPLLRGEMRRVDRSCESDEGGGEVGPFGPNRGERGSLLWRELRAGALKGCDEGVGSFGWNADARVGRDGKRTSTADAQDGDGADRIVGGHGHGGEKVHGNLALIEVHLQSAANQLVGMIVWSIAVGAVGMAGLVVFGRGLWRGGV